MVEARYSSLRAVKGGLAWLREPVAGVLGEGVASPEDDAPRPVLERFDLRKREVAELVGELDWFDVSGDGTRLVVKDHDELRILPSEHKEDHGSSESVTVDLSRARFQADPAALWQHAFAEAGRLMRRDFWNPGMSGVDWDAVLDSYRPLLDRIRGADDFTDLMWEAVAELGTSHAYIVRAGQDFRGSGPGPAAVGLLGADISRDPAGRWLVDRVLPGETSDPRARSPLEAPGVVIKAGDELIAVDGRPVDPLLGPAPLLAGTVGKPVELAVRPQGADPEVRRRVVVVPLRDERRLRYQDWVAGRRRLVRELGDGRIGYLHIPNMIGEGWADFHRDLRTEMQFDALVMDVRGNGGGHISAAGGGEAGPPCHRLGPGTLDPAGVLSAGRAARPGGHRGRRVRRLGRGHRHGRDQAARPRPGGRHPHLGRRGRHRRRPRPRAGRRHPHDRAAVRVLVRRVRLGRGELRRRPGRRGAAHAGRLGRGA